VRKLNYKKLTPIIGAVALTVLGFGAVKTYAYSNQRQDPLVDRLVTRFGLKETEVQEVFNQMHQERQTEMQSKLEDKLNSLVSEGKLSAEAKQKIVEKHKELQAKQTKPDNWREMSREERQLYMQSNHTEMENWAKENGIDISLFEEIGLGRGMGMGRAGGR
jgi:Skp family chaperone for outer membrane proteins